jgi:hypothetical protein
VEAETVIVRRVEDLLEESKATPAFKEAVKSFIEGEGSSLIEYNQGSPRIKVERAITKLLEEYPDLPIERVVIDGNSGCEYYNGKLAFYAPAERVVSFYWDCHWRAGQAGYEDYYGFPDQARAAREFGYQCFREFKEVK